MSFYERRHSYRKNLILQAKLRLQGASVNTLIRDISLGGALVMIDDSAAFLLGTPCQIGLTSSEQDQCISLNGLIIHRETNCLGVKFVAVSSAQANNLLKILASKSLSSDLINREFNTLLSNMETSSK